MRDGPPIRWMADTFGEHIRGEKYQEYDKLIAEILGKNRNIVDKSRIEAAPKILTEPSIVRDCMTQFHNTMQLVAVVRLCVRVTATRVAYTQQVHTTKAINL